MKKIIVILLGITLANGAQTVHAMEEMDTESDSQLSQQLTQEMDTFPDAARSLALENAIKAGEIKKITALIMDGVVIDPDTEKQAIKACGKTIYDACASQDLEDVFGCTTAIAVISEQTAIENLTNILAVAKSQKKQWDTHIAKVLNNDVQLPSVICNLITSYKP